MMSCPSAVSIARARAAACLALLALVAVLLLPAAPASAQVVSGTFRDWTVYTMDRGGQKMCYMGTRSKRATGTFKRRGTPYLLVTHRNATTDEVSTSSGYPYKVNSEVVVKVDGKKDYKLFTRGEIAWAYTEQQDRELVQAMQAGNSMTVAGTSGRDTTSVDTYSLMGFGAAYKQMKSLCK